MARFWKTCVEYIPLNFVVEPGDEVLDEEVVVGLSMVSSSSPALGDVFNPILRGVRERIGRRLEASILALVAVVAT